MEYEKIPEDVKYDIFRRYGVQSVGRGREGQIVAGVRRKAPEAQLAKKNIVPRDVDGVKTDVIETGLIRALAMPSDAHFVNAKPDRAYAQKVHRLGRYRPASGGCSIGHYAISAGTFGCVVRSKYSGEKLILSNNHVLANSNDANSGDHVLQPGPHDGGVRGEDTIGVLSRFVKLKFIGEELSDCMTSKATAATLNALWAAPGKVGMRPRLTRFKAFVEEAGVNLVDAAIALPTDEVFISDGIMDIGSIVGEAEEDLDVNVQKSGRTTGYTTGRVEQVDVTTQVNYGGSKIAVFEDQFMVSGSPETPKFSQPGDSGSVVLDMNGNIIGLLFAGSDVTTIVNRIENVFVSLGVEL